MKTVYGLMINAGSATEMLWDLGVWETEEAAKDYLENELKNVGGTWVGELKVNDSITQAVQVGDEMVACTLCGIMYNEADVNKDEYEGTVICINCEPEYRASLRLNGQQV
ncbi:hypothetical protein [Mesobacillus harenae]|uniref:hypothetical protein n=1 Tax=Mesobacillus harenae TaxID=2213203 RepID=UPI00157FCD97|nr:hypothetical protein [Mesobacillus harenae]